MKVPSRRRGAGVGGVSDPLLPPPPPAARMENSDPPLVRSLPDFPATDPAAFPRSARPLHPEAAHHRRCCFGFWTRRRTIRLAPRALSEWVASTVWRPFLGIHLRFPSRATEPLLSGFARPTPVQPRRRSMSLRGLMAATCPVLPCSALPCHVLPLLPRPTLTSRCCLATPLSEGRRSPTTTTTTASVQPLWIVLPRRAAGWVSSPHLHDISTTSPRHLGACAVVSAADPQ